MCLQQAKYARVCTRALLANLRFMNYEQGRDTPLLIMIGEQIFKYIEKIKIELNISSEFVIITL